MSRLMLGGCVLFLGLLLGLAASCGGGNSNSGDGNNPGSDDDIGNDDDINNDDDDSGNDDDIINDDDTHSDDDLDDDITYGDVVMERVEGGQIGEYGVAATIDGSDRIHVATTLVRSLVIYSADGAGGWSTEVVDDPAEYPRMTADPAGNLYLLYRRSFDQKQAYATNISGSWEIAVMNEAPDCLAIAADSQGRAHLACVESGNLLHLTRNGGAWESETVENNGSVTPYAAIAVGKDDSIHLAYTVQLGASDKRIHYATAQDGNWHIEDVSGALEDAFAVDLAVDSTGIPQVVYEAGIYDDYYGWTYDYHYGKRGDSGAWTNDNIDYSGQRDNPGGANRDKADRATDEAQHLSIAINLNDVPYVVIYGDCCTPPGWNCESYGPSVYDWVNGVDLVFNSADAPQVAFVAGTYKDYVTFDGEDYLAVASPSGTGDWNNETLESISWTSWGSSIAEGADGSLQIALYDGKDLKYAVRQENGWQVSTVFSWPLGFDYQPDLAIGPDGTAHISFGAGEYYDDLKVSYATNANGAWSFSNLEPGSYTSITLNADNQPTIAFMNWGSYGMDTSVRYGIVGQNGWKSWLVASNGEPGSPDSVAVGADGVTHICYTQYSYAMGLYHAWGNENSWNVETIVSGDYATNCSILLDSENSVHLLYTLEISGQLVYATNRSGAWTSHVLWSDADSGSFAVDADGVYVVWHRYGPPSMYYSTNVTGDWKTYILDRGVDVGGYTSVVLGSDDRLHASHYGSIWHVSFPKKPEN
jgi:hypothetical protein